MNEASTLYGVPIPEYAIWAVHAHEFNLPWGQQHSIARDRWLMSLKVTGNDTASTIEAWFKDTSTGRRYAVYAK